jgi:three-Cys-motif partner protein
MRQCREGLQKMGHKVTFHALFIEKDKNAFRKLQQFLETIPSHEVVTDALPGDFFGLRRTILDWCGKDFTFFFIDPKGWKKVVEIPTLTPLLQRPNSEFLINFMYDFLLRTHTQEFFQKDMQAIFGIVPDTNGMSSHDKEEYLINLYKMRIKEIVPAIGGRPRAVTVPILYPLKDRTLYHLMYLTRHAKGICVFMEESEKLESVQPRARAQAKQDRRESRSHQLELFVAAEVKRYWLNNLLTSPRFFGIEELAGMLEETGWFESDLQAAFADLQRAGSVKNLDDKNQKRRKNFVHFHKNNNQGERLIKVET